MSIEKFLKLYKLVLSQYKEILSNHGKVSEPQLTTIFFHESQLNHMHEALSKHYDRFIQDEDTIIGVKTAETCVALLKAHFQRKFEDAEFKMTEEERASILKDPYEWVIDGFNAMSIDLEPDYEAMDLENISEDQAAHETQSRTKNSEMLKKYTRYLIACNFKIRRLMYLSIQNSDNQELQDSLIKSIYTLALIIQSLSFDIRMQYDDLNTKDAVYYKGTLRDYLIDHLIFYGNIFPEYLFNNEANPYDDIAKQYFSNEEGRTLHIALVFDGVGDFIHMQNWVSAYEEQYPNQSDLMIFFDSKFHTYEDIQKMIDSLPANHCLKTFTGEIKIVDVQNANIALKRALFKHELFFEPGEFKSKYKALFGISHLNPILRRQVNNYAIAGLPSCVINEIGVYAKGPTNYASLTIGIANKEECCGMFFNSYQEADNIRQIIDSMSERLQRVIFGENYKLMTPEQKISALDELDIISGYYQAKRSTFALESVIQQKAKMGRKTKLIVTGHNEIPTELQHLNPDENFSITCCKLNTEEYQLLMRLLQFEPRHIFFCSGDNTFAESISISKPILYLNRTPEHKDSIKEDKHQSISDFIDILLIMHQQLNDQNKLHEANLLLQIIEFTRLSLLKYRDLEVKIVIPSNEALIFYKKFIVPELKKHFDLTNNIQKIVNQISTREQVSKRPRIQ